MIGSSELRALIAAGEGPELEFKSTLRYDLNEQKVNKALQKMVTKTVAAGSEPSTCWRSSAMS